MRGSAIWPEDALPCVPTGKPWLKDALPCVPTGIIPYIRDMISCIKYTFLGLALCMTAGVARGQTYFLNGDAVFLGDDCYRLTSEANFQNGTVWYGEQIDLNQAFDIQFRMNLGSIDGNGADGICFVLQTVGTSAIGASGGGMGYLDFGTSLGVEFDTWQNGEYNDPGFDHIAIHRDGNISHNSPLQLGGPVQMDPFNQNTEDGQDHVVQINWDPATQTMQVYFDCTFRVQAQVDLINSIFSGQNLVYWGFTAATGGSFNNQTVCLQENILNVGDEVLICPGASTVLSSGASLDGTYLWTPSDFLDDPTSATPVANPPATTTYNVQFTDLCGNNVDADIMVIVEPLEVTTSGGQVLTCAAILANVFADSNFPMTEYTWTTADGSINGNPFNPQLVTSVPGTYTVIATALDVCVDSTTVIITADQVAPVPDAGPDGIINCFSPTLSLTGNAGIPDPLIQWTASNGGVILSGAGTLTPQITAAGTYTLTTTDISNGCVGTDALIVTEDFTEPIISIPLQDTLTCIRQSVTMEGITIDPSVSISFSWATETGNITSSTGVQNITVDAPGIYSLTVVNEINGCSSTESAEIIASDDLDVDLSAITFPNVFTPNGDEKNGQWYPFLRNLPDTDLQRFFTEYKVTVYNRWGTIIFEGNRSAFHWNGRDVEEGVYYFIAEYASDCGGGIRDTREGYIHLKR